MSRPLFFERRFWPMWTALSFGAFTDNVMRQALIIGIAYGWIGGGDVGEDAVPVIGSVLAAAMLLFSSVSGQFAEKYETATMFRRTKLLELALAFAAAAAFAFDSAILLVICLFALGAQSALFSPARISAMPKYLAPDELVRGNGLCNAGLYIFILLGLFFGGLLVARPQGGLYVSAAMIVSAVVGFAAALRAPPAPPGAPGLSLDLNPWRQTVRIAGFVRAARGVLRPVLGAAFFYYATTLITVLAPLLAKNALHADESVATAIMGLFAVGVGAGAIVAASLARGRSGLGFSTLGVCLAGASSLAVFALTSLLSEPNAPRGLGFLFGDPLGLACAASFVAAAAAMGLYVVPLQAATQRRAPAETRARIMAAGNMANAAAAMLGSLSVLAVTALDVPPGHAFLGVALLQGAVALYMLRRRNAVPEGLYDEVLSRGRIASVA